MMTLSRLYRKLKKYCEDNAKILSISLLLILNTLVVLCMFDTQNPFCTNLILVICFLASLWNTWSFFTKFKRYQLLRARRNLRGRMHPITWKAPRMEYDLNDKDVKYLKKGKVAVWKPDELAPSLIETIKLRNFWYLDQWIYENYQRDMFCFFNPIQLVSFIGAKLVNTSVELKWLLFTICYLQCFLIYYIMYKHEEKEFHQRMIHSEVLFEQMRATDLTWKSGAHLVNGLYHLVQKYTAPLDVEDSYVPTSAFDDMTEADEPSEIYDEETDSEIMDEKPTMSERRRCSIIQHDMFEKVQKELQEEIQRVKRQSGLSTD